MTKQSIGEMIEAANPQAPRVTPEHLESLIAEEHYFNLGHVLDKIGHPASGVTNLVTVCILVLRNGYVLTGESACVSHENFNEEIGKAVARKMAFDKMWPLEGYLLKSKIHEGW
jgi:hypothetical protein